MFAPCPHKWSKKLNKLLPPQTHPYDRHIPDCCIIAGYCDMSAECGIRECAFFSIDPEDERFALDVQTKFYTGEFSQKKHDDQMWRLWDKEAAKNLYAQFGDRYINNEPLLSAERMVYMVKNNLIDVKTQDDGSVRVSINSAKERRHDWIKLLEANKDLFKDESPGGERE